MHKVTIDGIDYYPAQKSTIGVAVSTYNRPDVLSGTLSRILKHTPGAHIVVVDDASPSPVKVPEGVILHRMEENGGIARSKNKGIEILMDLGCEHLFLFDDDAYPLVDDWFAPYIESPEPHLMYMFEDLAGAKKLKDVKVLYEDDQHKAFSGPRGVMLYAHRSVIEKVGGMDLVYGRWGYEHGDWSNRIHHEGLTSWRYADVQGSDKLIYSLDEHEAVERSVTNSDRNSLAKKNAIIHNERVGSWYRAFCPYRDPRRVVITSLLNSTADPQRGSKIKGDLSAVKAWADSIKGATPVLIVDHEVPSSSNIEIVQVPPSDMNLYYRRWLLAYQYLRDHPEVSECWVTDGTDVEMLVEPWHGMEPGVVYVGSEPRLMDDSWMRDKHKAQKFQNFIQEHYDKPIINAGLLGGSREDVMNFAHKVYRQWYDIESLRFWGKDKSPQEVGDMAAFNVVAYEHFIDRIETGPKVHTVFKAEERNNTWSWFKHK